MTLFSQAKIIRAGDSNPSPARDFIVLAGDSSTTARDFLVKYVKYLLSANSLSIGVASETLEAWNIGRIDLDVKSESALLLLKLRRLQLLNYLLQVTSQQISIQQIDLVIGAIKVLSGDAEFFGTASTLNIGIASSEFQVFRVNLGSSKILVSSPFEISSGIPRVAVEIGGGSTNFSYLFRIWTVITHLLSVTGEIDVWSLPKIAVQCSSPSTKLRYMVRSWQVQTHVIGVRGPTTNIIPINTEVLTLGISGSANLTFERGLEILPSSIAVSSSPTNIRDSTIRAITLALEVGSSSSDFRFLPSGFLPSGAPTTRVFTPNKYAVIKTGTMGGRVVRNLMASRPVDALLTLEYINATDLEAEQVLEAYNQSYGTYYGFKLPPLIAEGGSSELSNYIRLFNSDLKWYFEAAPRIESVSKGLSNIQIQLKAHTEVK